MISNKFTTVSQQLVNYDWTDLFAGVGYIVFYAGQATATAAAVTSFLTRRTLDGYPNKSSTTSATPLDLDFDITFEKEVTIRGDALINYTQISGAAGSTATAAIKVYHVNGATETEIGSITGPTRSAVTTREMLVVPLTEKHFAIGEKLRLNITFTIVGANAGTLYFDPSSGISESDDLGRTVQTNLIMETPFKIERQ